MSGITSLLAQVRNQLLLPSLFAPIESIPLFGHSVQAGFPSPTDDYV